MNAGRSQHAATLLPDGNVLAAGGAVGALATRTTWEQIRLYVNTHCGSSFTP